MMRVSELRARKKALETAIAALVFDFEKETGVAIEDLITLNHLGNSHEAEQESPRVQVEVHLEM